MHNDTELLYGVPMTRMRRWPYSFALLLSIAVAAAALASSIYLGRPMTDPNGFLGPAYVRLPLLALLFFGGGIVLDAVRTNGWKQLPRGMLEVVKNEWNLRRVLCITAGMLSFYICYVSYRNLKSDLPIYREDVLYDRELAHSDLWLGGGTNPAVFLHDLLGTGFTAEVLSFVYLAYLPLIPISLGAALILSRNVAIGAWYATTLSLNWVLGTVSYYILPALGPAFAQPGLYGDLTPTGVSDLQQSLITTRLDFLADPIGSGEIQGVAAFASLHVSVTFAAALFMMHTRQKPLLQTLTWVFFGLTVVATLYFGWHYIVDDIAGMGIGWASVALGAWVTGNRRRRSRQRTDLREAEHGEVSALAETA
ncbi:MAG: phosphatase PAP2 family protein [Brevibacterium sp.]|nr:phosphatase PAP2 family protein [Brevibacterium sp.]MDN6159008.1 phosphatase PAP2 family protein [Brevibacterium sp.]MDN6176351.1 phosphatase PAP2 family protein [Brevibacterium sp.]MDN6188671.1 phosphatase PAP2 family protein [Brevibacterium sp.]MDN6604289.1 phosphatase PAP2 family protein [Brevibacterium sp.]